MPLQITISSEILCAGISAAGVLISALVSQSTAKHAANKEIEKMKLTWAREDITSFDAEFSEMIRMAILFVERTNIGHPDTLAAIGAIRAKETGELAQALDDLYRFVKTDSYQEADALIDRVILLKRKSSKHLEDRQHKRRCK